MTQALITREHNGHAFTFREDGWFNMTKAAKHFGKQLQHFWNNVSTDEYILALNDRLSDHRNHDDLSRAVRITAAKDVLVQTQRGWAGSPEVGTWAHPKLAVFFARWLDVRFAVWCDAMIEDILKGKAEVVITKPDESAVMALPKDFASM